MYGGGITCVDFFVYEWVEVNRIFYSELLNDVENLEKFQKRIEALPNIAEYMKSDKFIKWPLNAKRAKWGGQ